MNRKNWIGVWVLIYSLTALAESPPLTSSEAPHSTPEAATDSSWLGAAQQELARREYHLSSNSQGLQAPNRAQGFRTYFFSDGVKLVHREADGEALASWTLVSLGRAGTALSLGTAEVTHENSLATLQWPGVSIQYDNDTSGLKQTISVEQSPMGNGILEVVLNVTDADPQLKGSEVILQNPYTSLRIGAIEAHDATGASLPVTISASSGTIRLAVSDKSASYPIKLQSVTSGGINGTLQSSQASSDFGDSVSGAGDVNGDGYADVIIGAQLYDNGEANEGVAFMFLGGPGAFDTTPDATLQANQASAQFGNSVAGAGDVNGDGYDDVVVGAYRFNNTLTDEGTTFIYFGGPGTFNTTADATLAFTQNGALFGRSVAGAGDINGDGYADIVIGAHNYDNGQSNEGGAFIYFGGSGAFDLTADAILEANDGGAWFGQSVAGAGDVNGDGYADVVVGAPNFGTVESGESDEGAAFIYFGGSGAFDTTADAQLESNQTGSDFGTSVAGAGDVNGDGYADVFVGAPNYTNDQINEGIALIYFGGPGAFNLTADALLESDATDADFGFSVAGAGDVNGDGYADVLVGSPLTPVVNTVSGRVFVYFGGAGTFNTGVDALLASSGQDGAGHGTSVAGPGDINGDGYADVLVGAPNNDTFVSNEILTSAGAAFIYYGGAARFSTTVDGLIESNQGGAQMGIGVAGAGDVNGDGYADVIVGAPTYDDGQVGDGAAFIYFGASGTFDTSADAQLESSQVGAALGWSVAGAGDVNGDGYSDVIVGALLFDNGQPDEGAAFIYFGGSGAFDTTHDAQLESNQAAADMGQSVAGAGDVNGDGFADVVVGAHKYQNGQSGEGAAFIYFGGAGAFDQAADAQLESNQTDARLGYSVAGAGDVNGDGFADVIVGARLFDNGQADEGAAFIYFGGAGAFNTVADAQLEPSQVEAYMGTSVAGAGDVNGDGFADVIVGAPGFENGQVDEGVAVVYFGGAGAFNTTPDEQLESGQAGANLGWSVSGAGDVNGDGNADVIVGAIGYSNGQASEGAAYIYTFESTGFPITILQSNLASAVLGISVAGAGDVNGDGFADVIAGATGYQNGQTSEGAAFVYFGTARGRPVLAGQFQGNATNPVQPWGFSQDTDGFVASLNATSPRGRERARLQLEACPSGAPFGSLLCNDYVAASWTEIGANPQGVTLNLAASGLTLDKLYHWRARVQYAPLHISAPGVVTPSKPPAGPWRRLQANGDVADIRTSVNAPPPELIFEDGFE